MIPEWEPPSGMRDPFVWRCARERVRWLVDIRGQLPKLADYAVAHTLASYGNKDGSRCRPGTERLADALGCDKKTVKRSVDWLAEHGWIWLMNPGVPVRGQANEYRLTIPAPFAVERGLWEEKFGPQWVERPAGHPKRPGVREGGHRRPPKPKTEGGHGRPPNQALGGHLDALGGHGCPETVDTGVPPPGSTHQESSHHSEKFLLCLNADASRRSDKPQLDVEDLDPDASDLVEQIEQRLEEELGTYPNADTCGLILSMVGRAHPNAILNAARARERDLESA